MNVALIVATLVSARANVNGTVAAGLQLKLLASPGVSIVTLEHVVDIQLFLTMFKNWMMD